LAVGNKKMATNGKIWCVIKKCAIGTLVTAFLTGAGYTAFHIISSEAQTTALTVENKEIKTELTRLNDKVDSTQPAVVAEQIKNLQQKQEAMDRKIDYNEQQSRKRHDEQMQGQTDILKLLIQIKNTR